MAKILPTSLTENDGIKLIESITLRLLCKDINDSNNFINLNFDIVVEPSSIEKEPPFELHDGVNYVNGDDSKIYLQLNAPNKDFIYVLGNFNQYIKSNESLMNVNPLNNKFWIEINDLNENENYWYQYEVFSKSPGARTQTLMDESVGSDEKTFKNNTRYNYYIPDFMDFSRSCNCLPNKINY